MNKHVRNVTVHVWNWFQMHWLYTNVSLDLELL